MKATAVRTCVGPGGAARLRNAVEYSRKRVQERRAQQILERPHRAGVRGAVEYVSARVSSAQSASGHRRPPRGRSRARSATARSAVEEVVQPPLERGRSKRTIGADIAVPAIIRRRDDTEASRRREDLLPPLRSLRPAQRHLHQVEGIERAVRCRPRRRSRDTSVARRSAQRVGGRRSCARRGSGQLVVAERTTTCAGSRQVGQEIPRAWRAG